MGPRQSISKVRDDGTLRSRRDPACCDLFKRQTDIENRGRNHSVILMYYGSRYISVKSNLRAERGDISWTKQHF